MHLAKALEFSATCYWSNGCEDEVIPFQGVIEAVTDGLNLEECLQHRTAPALPRLHPRPRPLGRDQHRTGVRLQKYGEIKQRRRENLPFDQK